MIKLIIFKKDLVLVARVEEVAATVPGEPDCNPDLLDRYYMDKKTLWELTHNVTIYGVKAEPYIEDLRSLVRRVKVCIVY